MSHLSRAFDGRPWTSIGTTSNTDRYMQKISQRGLGT
jgi:hypothetical protein